MSTQPQVTAPFQEVQLSVAESFLSHSPLSLPPSPLLLSIEIQIFIHYLRCFINPSNAPVRQALLSSAVFEQVRKLWCTLVSNWPKSTAGKCKGRTWSRLYKKDEVYEDSLDYILNFSVYLNLFWDFPGGAVDKNPPANAGNMGSSPGPGRSHTPRSN